MVNDPYRPKVGLALGSGSARGWAHIGVIRVLQDAGIEPDIVCGTSIGSLVGAAYSAGELDELESWVQSLTWKTVVGLIDFTISAGFIKGIRLIAPFDFAGILLKEQEGLRLARSFGYVEGSYPSPETVIMSLCVPGQTTSVEEYLINSKQPLLITDEAALSKWPLLPTAQPVRSMQAIPLAYPGGVIGALLLCSAAVGP